MGIDIDEFILAMHSWKLILYASLLGVVVSLTEMTARFLFVGKRAFYVNL